MSLVAASCCESWLAFYNASKFSPSMGVAQNLAAIVALGTCSHAALVCSHPPFQFAETGTKQSGVPVSMQTAHEANLAGITAVTAVRRACRD